MFDLDYLKGMKKLDPSSMMENVLNFPEMVKTGIRIGKDAKVPLDYKNASKVLFTGLGGSAIGGDILIFAVSHSGNTEETISAFKDALSKKAKIIVITSGGALKILAKENKIPVILVPGEKPPRASLPYLFFPVLIIMYKLGFAKVKTGELSELLKILEMLKKTYAPEVKLEDNPAKKLASKLFVKPVIIFGSADSTDAVATRWKCQLSENSKVITFACTIPEMNHNEIVSWGMLKISL